MGHISEDRTKEGVASIAWWPQWEQGLCEYIKTCERFQKENRKNGKRYGLLQHIEEPKHPWQTINIDWVTGLVPGGNQNSTTGKSPSLVGKRWNPLLPVDHLKENLLTIHPTAKDFHGMWKIELDTAAKCIDGSKEYNKQRYDKTHMGEDFKEGYQVLVYTLSFNNLKGPTETRD
ncbi:hypothetical protein O181_020201 [Austropuccinia psidii MF-1]|uniref:Integrase zinc-binding domain-containing protein n=1 Tax=Austropuccinia psidii MF-1 TaxID=1389203 RepID=A0A9Q3CD09_9BASI|nr:hypothetical protein [Austropuccinia psidii MF-1]